jgi:2-polyprenyl-3-methyl-5-hydroxy-6-metoxy-1,4-benzoquinol methylase
MSRDPGHWTHVADDPCLWATSGEDAGRGRRQSRPGAPARAADSSWSHTGFARPSKGLVSGGPKMNDEYKNYGKFLAKQTQFGNSIRKEYSLFNNYYKKNYLRHLPGNRDAHILDVGCGTGNFLFFLRRQGYRNSKGIDLVGENVELCKKNGFLAEKGDALEYMEQTRSKFDVIVLNNVIEHLDKGEVIELLSLAKTRLNKEGRFILKTVNCNNIHGVTTYFSDFTHKTPFTEKIALQVSLIAEYNSCKCYNVYMYPGIPILDQLFFLFQYALYRHKVIYNYLHGQKPFDVHSKNLLVVLER